MSQAMLIIDNCSPSASLSLNSYSVPNLARIQVVMLGINYYVDKHLLLIENVTGVAHAVRWFQWHVCIVAPVCPRLSVVPAGMAE